MKKSKQEFMDMIAAKNGAKSSPMKNEKAIPAKKKKVLAAMKKKVKC